MFWCACLVLVILEVDRKDSAVSNEAMPTSTRELLQKLFYNGIPRDLIAAILVWSPNHGHNLSFPYSGHCHWNWLARTYKAGSPALTGTGPGFKNATVSWIFPMACLIVATECAWSLSRGSNDNSYFKLIILPLHHMKGCSQCRMHQMHPHWGNSSSQAYSYFKCDQIDLDTGSTWHTISRGLEFFII